MVDWKRKLQIKVWGHQELNFDWIDVKEIKEDVDGYLVYEAKDTIPWHVRRDGTIWHDYNQICLVRNKRTVDDNTKKINQKPDNRAVFYFERKGDVYTLTGWKNVMSADDINQKYGKDVYKAYIWDNTQPSFSQKRYDSLPDDVLVNVNKSKDYLLESGDVFSKDEYELIVDACKQAGERLSKIIRDSKKPEKIEVKI